MAKLIFFSSLYGYILRRKPTQAQRFKGVIFTGMKKLYQKNSNLFGQNLSRYRKLSGLTQDDLGQTVGVSRTYISALEHGRANPTLKLMSQLALALEIDVGNLLSTSEEHLNSEEEEHEIHKNAWYRK